MSPGTGVKARAEKVLATLISTMLSPLTAISLAIALLVLTRPPKHFIESLLGIFLFVYLLPWGPALVYRAFGRDPNYVSGRERLPLMLMGFISYSAGILYFYALSEVDLLGICALMLSFSLLFLLGNVFSKPSIHVGIFTAIVIYFAMLIDAGIALLLLLVPLISWSRVKLGAHTPKQTFFGFILGAAAGMVGASYPVYYYVVKAKSLVESGPEI